MRKESDSQMSGALELMPGLNVNFEYNSNDVAKRLVDLARSADQTCPGSQIVMVIMAPLKN